MIDEQRTLEIFGYTSDELKPKSNRLIVVVCEECGKYRVMTKNGMSARKNCGALCQICAARTPERRRQISIANLNRPPVSEETRKKNSISGKNRPQFTQKHCDNISKGKLGKSTKLKGYERTFEERKRLSAKNQGIEEEEWTGFARERKYCSKFNDELKLKIRAQYNFECVMCDMVEEESKKVYREVLSIHHIDGNKDQGCNGNEINMIPLCKKCHGQSHHEPMKSRIYYLVDNGILL